MFGFGYFFRAVRDGAGYLGEDFLDLGVGEVRIVKRVFGFGIPREGEADCDEGGDGGGDPGGSTQRTGFRTAACTRAESSSGTGMLSSREILSRSSAESRVISSSVFILFQFFAGQAYLDADVEGGEAGLGGDFFVGQPLQEM